MHLIRNSLVYASWKDRKLLATAIRPIYTAASAEAALAELDTFEAVPWGKKFPGVVAAWRRAWDKMMPFFAFSHPRVGALSPAPPRARTSTASWDAASQDVQKCDTAPSQAKTEFWDVTYTFRGEEHTIQTTSQPGRTIMVNGQGEPRV